jgi:hypothetical protein
MAQWYPTLYSQAGVHQELVRIFLDEWPVRRSCGYKKDGEEQKCPVALEPEEGWKRWKR